MMHAYDENLLKRAEEQLGNALACALYNYNFNADDFMKMFISSGLARRFENGDPFIISGMSGSELCVRAIELSGYECEKPDENALIKKGMINWAGYAVAYYQWYSGFSFKEILSFISMNRICSMHGVYSTQDDSALADFFTGEYSKQNPLTKLKARRQKAGLSQSQLAKLAGIPVRTLQQYEQRQKNINKAAADSLVNLSKVLNCSVSDLMEAEKSAQKESTAQ